MESKVTATMTVTVQIGKKTITLTEAEARELKAKLDAMFGNTVWYQPYPVWPTCYPSYPQITYWCGAETATGTAWVPVFDG